MQAAFNIAVGLAAFLGGYVLRSIGESLRSLTDADAIVMAKIQQIELLVAGQYVTHSEMEKLSAALFSKLDKIENKLDMKADKNEHR